MTSNPTVANGSMTRQKIRFVSGHPCTHTSGTPPTPSRTKACWNRRGSEWWTAKRHGSMSLTAAPYARRMTPDEFRRQGHALVDWIADYVEGVERYPVASSVKPGDIRSLLPPSPPPAPESFAAVLSDVDQVIVPGLTHWQHPSFFAYFPANSTYPAILGDLLSAGLGVNGMLWATSPACTELETLMCDWMVELLDLPAAFRSESDGGGVIQGTASEATL